jgi:heat shock protein HslJ
MTGQQFKSRPWIRALSLTFIAALALTACAAPTVPTAVATLAPVATNVPPTASPANTNPVASNAITDVVWQWSNLIDHTTNENKSVPLPENYTITVKTDGTVTGQADCNAFSGTYSQQNGFKITLGPSTTAFCGEGSWDVQYLQLLDSVVAGGPDGAGALILESTGGAQRMVFKNGGPAN